MREVQFECEHIKSSGEARDSCDGPDELLSFTERIDVAAKAVELAKFLWGRHELLQSFDLKNEDMNEIGHPRPVWIAVLAVCACMHTRTC